MILGKLTFHPINEAPEQVSPIVKTYIDEHDLQNGVWVSKIKPELADTATFCEYYDIGMDISANCVIVEAKRAEKVWYVACLVLAISRADINGTIRRHVEARKVSFAALDKATALSGMEYGGITPIGLPARWPILIDEAVLNHERVIVGSGIRGSKVLINSALLKSLPNVQVLALTKV